MEAFFSSSSAKDVAGVLVLRLRGTDRGMLCRSGSLVLNDIT